MNQLAQKCVSKKALVSVLGLALMIAVLWIISLTKSTASVTIAFVDEVRLEKAYGQVIQKIMLTMTDYQSMHDKILKQQKDFVEHLNQDVLDYQEKHHVVVLKNTSLFLPDAKVDKRFDITDDIEKTLKKQGLLG